MPRFHVEKSVEIAASPEVVFEKVVDFRTWTTWSPWLCSEPTAKVTVSEVSNAPGSLYQWEGTVVGAGELEHLQVEPNRLIEDEIRFSKPYKSKAKVGFDFAPSGLGTKVTWRMSGSLPWFLFWMTGMVKGAISMDYARGLRMLKEWIETGSIQTQTNILGNTTIGPIAMAGLRRRCAISDIGPSMQGAIGEIMPLFQQNNLPVDGQMMAAYHKFDIGKQTCEYTVGLTLPSADTPVPTSLERWSTPETKAFCVEHVGDYNHLGNAWSAANQHVRYHNWKLASCSAFEIYENDPEQTPVDQLRTKIYLPLK
ncbi:SRPBCC family protein [Bremerella sp. JC817]|uniref:SRPBCC family protein n=1 Tax=Bremerella sp. JC817 TaxID=3231756 RepID=UPI00345773C3